jgi:glutamine cyclotransferase
MEACWPQAQPKALKVSQITIDFEDPPTYSYRVMRAYPHDPSAFTQGLVYDPVEGVLYEGTGIWGESSLRKVELASGRVLKIRRLSPQYFGEGIAVWDDRIVQLTWQSRTGFVYTKGTFELLRQFHYETEGWGLTYDGQRLIMSDGSETLYFWDPETLQEIGRVEVHDRSATIKLLNELEFINGLIWANVWQTDRIAVIDPNTGRVGAWLDLSGILKPEDRTGHEDVLNGIAYDPARDRLFVTGKLWPKLFEIELIPSQAND